MKLWIARQRDNSLYLFTHKPTLFCGRWCMNGVNQYYTKFGGNREKNDLFPEVTFENSPREVKLKLIENEYKCRYKRYYRRCNTK